MKRPAHKPKGKAGQPRCLDCGGRLSLASGRFCWGCRRARREAWGGRMNVECGMRNVECAAPSAAGAPVTVDRCGDVELLDGLWHTPGVGEHGRNDTHPPLAELSVGPLLAQGCLALLVRRKGEPAGFWLLRPLGYGVYEVHTNLLPRVRGAAAYLAAQLAMEYLFVHTDAVKLVSYCPSHRPQVLEFAVRCGWKVERWLTGAWPVNGVRHDVAWVGLTVRDWFKQATQKLS